MALASTSAFKPSACTLEYHNIRTAACKVLSSSAEKEDEAYSGQINSNLPVDKPRPNVVCS
jgi:hypothetical protein